MNNRLRNLYKKATSQNKSVYLLEMLGFDAVDNTNKKSNIFDTDIKEELETIHTNQPYENQEQIMDQINVDTIQNEKKVYSSNFIADYSTSDLTDEFKPTNITEQFKAIWINLEQRRKWLYPAVFVGITIVLSSYVITNFFQNQKENEVVVKEINNLGDEINTLYFTIDEIIEIASEPFFSKYDVSNASAELQVIESKLIEYESTYMALEYNFNELTDYQNLNDITSNLNNYMNLINKLDLVLTYRILNTEILIYPDLKDEVEPEAISELTTTLSNVSAISISNYEQLPFIQEFERHNKILLQSIDVANELHGQYLASLRNTETNTSNQLILSIGMNKEIVKRSYDKSLEDFKNQIYILYDLIKPIP